MTTETELAFAHPEARSVATADRPLDRLSLRNHLAEVEIGAFQSERDVVQRLQFNVVVEIAPLPNDLGDDVDRILSYDRLTEAIAHELAAERFNLLETLCERVADRILLQPQAERVFVRIEKLDRGPGALGVEIVRKNGQAVSEAEPSSALSPVVAFLSEKAMQSPNLTSWIDQLAAGAAPIVFCVAPDNTVAQGADTQAARRRMALLGGELAAWRLADKDQRCVVVDNRTELDWAFKNGQISVWAPTKIILDTPEGSVVSGDDGVELAQWFAAFIGAKEVLIFDEPQEQDGWPTTMPLRIINLEQREL